MSLSLSLSPCRRYGHVLMSSTKDNSDWFMRVLCLPVDTEHLLFLFETIEDVKRWLNAVHEGTLYVPEFSNWKRWLPGAWCQAHGTFRLFTFDRWLWMKATIIMLAINAKMMYKKLNFELDQSNQNKQIYKYVISTSYKSELRNCPNFECAL